jgi:PAS domain S-box-containing protein
MAKEARSALLRYGSAVGLTALATILRLALNQLLGNTAPFVFFVMAVAVTALTSGLGPALLTAFAGAVIGLFVWLLPTHSLADINSTVLTTVTVYLLLCVFISILIEWMRRVRQRAEVNAAALNESRKLLSTTLGSIGDAVISTDVEGRVTFMNQVAESLTGWTRGEARDKPIEEVFVIVNEQSRQPVDSPVAKTLREGAIVGLANHTMLIKKDGSEVPIDDSGAPIKDDQGKFLGAVLVFRDITERRKAEDALRQSRERLDLTLEASGIGFWYCDLPFTELVWDVRSKVHFGLPADQSATLKTFYERLHKDDRAHVRQAIERAIAEHSLYNVDYRTVGLDGRLRWVHATGRTFYDNDGTPTRFAGITIEVTERKQAEEALAFLASIVESSDDAIIGKQLDGTILSWNAGAAQLYGYSAEEVIGKDIRLLEAPGHNDIDDILAQLKSGKRTHHYETVRVKKNGERVEVALTVSPIKDQTGTLTGASTIARDITERKRAEEERTHLLAEQQRLIIAEKTAREAAEASEQRARFLAEASAALASSLDYEATLRSVARLAVPRLADWCVVHIAEDGQHLKQLAIMHIDPARTAEAEELGRRFPPDPNAPRGLLNVLRTGKSEYYPEIEDALLTRMARDEDHLNVMRAVGMKSAMLVPLAARNRTLGVITFVASESHPLYTAADLALAEDLARRAALAVDHALLFAEAYRARAEAEEANRMKDEFLATVSHELRTPLNAIVGWSHMLRTRSFDEATTVRALETIERNAKSQAQIVEDILDVSRIITGKLRLDVQPVDLAAIIDAALDSVRPAAEAKEIRLQAILDPRAGPVSGDANRLQQVVWNLLANAVKFTPKNERIQVRLGRVDSQVEIIVADTGQGIRADLLPFVFDRFRQGDSTSTRLHGGLGLGLAIVRHLVELHGGTVTAESAGEDQGATFTVKLPLMALQAERYDTGRAQSSVATAPPLPEAPDLAGIKVLVVDDEPDTRDMLRTMIEQLGAQVRVCASSGEALQVFHEWAPDVIVSDIEMPGEDGYQLMRQIRELPPEHGGKTPAVALTAYARTDDRLRAFSAGYQMHVAKPADPLELAAVIASLASQRNNRVNL